MYTHTEQLVTVTDLRTFPNGNLKATATVRYGSTTVHGCRIIQQAGQRPYVAPPQRSYDLNGRTAYAPVVRWDAALAERITTAVLAAWERATNGSPADLFGLDAAGEVR